MDKYFDFEVGDIVTYKAKYGPTIQSIVTFIKKNDRTDTVGTITEFLRVNDHAVSNDYSEVELIEVFRRYGDIYKKIF